MISLEKLVPGGVYIVNAKDFSIAVWNGESFRGPRYAHANWSLSDERPWEEGPPFGTARAKERVGDAVLRPPYDGHNVLQLLIAFNAYYESFQINRREISGNKIVHENQEENNQDQSVNN